MSLTEQETDQLARYNAERGRGLVHTDEWVARMAELQQRFNETYRQVANERVQQRRASLFRRRP